MNTQLSARLLQFFVRTDEYSKTVNEHQSVGKEEQFFYICQRQQHYDILLGCRALSDLKLAILDGSIGIPKEVSLPWNDRDIPYSLIKENDFSLRLWWMMSFRSWGLPNDKIIFNNIRVVKMFL